MRFAFTAWLVLSLSGCSSGASERMDSMKDAAPQAGDEIDSRTVAITGQVREFIFLPKSPTALAGVRICQQEPRICTESTASGGFMLDGLDPGREVLLTFEKAGYLTIYEPLVTPLFSAAIPNTPMTPEQPGVDPNAPFNQARVAAGIPSQGDWAGGSIIVSAYRSAGSGLDETMHIRVTPDVGVAPIYSLSPDSALSAAIPPGKTAGWAIFTSLPPGDDYEVELTMDNGECTRVPDAGSGWAAKDGRTNAVRVPVGEHVVSYGSVLRCVGNAEPAPRQ